MKGKALCCLFCSVLLTGAFSGCFLNRQKGDVFEYRVEQTTEGEEMRVVITVTDVEDGCTLLRVMEQAKTDGKLTYEISGGMITSINGKANDVDYDPCWMLYTSDSEMSNSEWGTITFGDKTLGSAILGAETLTVLEGETYVWAYRGF